MGELQRFFSSFSSKAIPGSGYCGLVHLLEEVDDVHVLLHKSGTIAKVLKTFSPNVALRKNLIGLRQVLE
jgi:hypothetical protein